MNAIRLVSQIGRTSAALALFGLVTPTTASAKTKTPFTDTEVVTGIVNPGTWMSDGQRLYITGLTLSAVENASDPRLAGTSTIWVDRITDLATGATTMWGRFRIENTGGAWEGYWFGSTSSSSAATMIGSGNYAGLVARWTYSGTGGDWTGYIVENGPKEVPMTLRGSVEEQIQWVFVAVLDPLTMQPTGEYGTIGIDTLVKGGGVGLHIGAYAEQARVGLITFANPTTADWSVMGTMKAANGDLLNWVATGQKDIQSGANDGTAHFAGGTGRFEAATGSFPVTSGTGRIRY